MAKRPARCLPRPDMPQLSDTVLETATTPDLMRPCARNDSVLANALRLFSGQVGIKIVSFGFSVFVIRHLGSEQYGRYAICVAFGGLFTVLSDLGLATMAMREIARDHRAAPRLFSNVLVLRLLLAVGVIGVTSLFAWVVGYDGQLRLGIFIAASGLLSYAVLGVADTVALGMERFSLSAWINFLAQAVTLALSAALVLGGTGFLGLLIAATLGVCATGLYAVRRLARETPLRAPIEPHAWRTLTSASLPFAAIMLALAVSYKADAVILSMFTGAAQIGAYAVAYNLIFTCATVSHSINLALFPSMTRQYAADPSASPVAFRNGARYLLFISLPVAAFVSLNARGIVVLLYGDALAAAARPLAALAWVIPLMFLSEFLGYVAIVVGRERLAARANWVASAVNVGLNLALIPIFGVMAAAIVTVLTETALVAQFFYDLRSTGLLSERRATYGRTLLSVGVLFVGLVAASVLSWPVVVLGAVAVVVYFVSSILLGAVGRQEAHFALAGFGRGAEQRQDVGTAL
jgi:O-antigen/teichoic acid export membrane protein